MKIDSHSILTRRSYVVALIAALILLVAFVGYTYYRYEERTARREKGNELKAIADLKIKQVSDWYKDELNDATVISRNPFLIEVVNNYLKGKSDRSLIVKHLNQTKAEHGYSDIILASVDGKVLSSTDMALQHVDTAVEKAMQLAARQETAVSTDIYRCSVHNVARIDFISPVKDNRNSVIAVMVFQMNPDDFLYPLIEFWPTASKTAETFIARKEENSILVLNRLRHLETPALGYKFSLDDQEAAIVKTVDGHIGFLDITDYRGAKVLAYTSPIIDTPWFMVAKVDRAEIFDDLYVKVGFVIVLAVCLILLAGVSLSYLYSRRSEMSLRESEERYRDLVENSGDLVCTHDLDGNLLSINKAVIKALGYTLENILQMNLRDIIVPEMRGKLSIYLRRIRRNGAAHGFMYVHTSTGEQRIWEYNNTLRTDGVEKPFVRGMSRDVTEQKLAEKQLSRSEKEFRRLSQEFQGLLDAIPDSLMLLDKDLKVLWANKAAAASIGETPESLVSRFCYTLWYKRTAPCEPCPVAESFFSGKHRNIVVTRSDDRIWDIRTVPLTDEQGRIVNVIEVKRDITEHRQMEENLKHAQKLEGIGQLAGGIAHDFNNVLNAVVGFAGLLQMKMDRSDPLMHYADEIVAAGQRGGALTHQILAFSRKQVLDMKPVNLNGIIKNLETMLHRLVREDISIQLNLASNDLVILADANQIDQILINLATNARDAMPDGGRLSISTEIFVMDGEYGEMRSYCKPGNYALITISDNGRGMGPETKSRIFEPFFTTKEVGKGTGLGLAVVHGIVKQHNGCINIYSEVGNGTVFKIYLPLTELVTEQTAKNHDEPIRGGTETILIAEDDAALRTLSRSVLSHHGYTVIDTVDGEDAIVNFERNKDSIKLVILDGIMPNKNGREAFDEIRKLCPDMKAIFVSGYAEDIFTHDGIPDTVAVFIQKPVTPNKLLRLVRKTLDGQ